METDRHMREKTASRRLNKAIAARGLCSRRKADELIFAGKVKVNGQLVANPATSVTDDAIIEVDGKPLAAPPKNIYALFYKPVQCVCTMNDPQGRKTVVDYFTPELIAARAFPVGRLDYFSEGLLLLTNDGDLAQRMTHPSHHQKKIYEVIIRENISEDKLETMRAGMTLDGKIRLAPVAAEATLLANGSTLLKLGLNQGINRQIRRMCAELNLTILRLKRIAAGAISIGNLRPGQIRLLTEKEKSSLLASVKTECRQQNRRRHK